jgi:hypothetical protein
MMQAALKLHAPILPGKRIEITAPELPESGTVELHIFLPETPQSRYPEALNIEYNTLIQTEWQRLLTAEEEARLAEIRAEINAIDAASGEDETWKQGIKQIHEQLAAIRREVEALPNAT